MHAVRPHPDQAPLDKFPGVTVASIGPPPPHLNRVLDSSRCLHLTAAWSDEAPYLRLGRPPTSLAGNGTLHLDSKLEMPLVNGIESGVVGEGAGTAVKSLSADNFRTMMETILRKFGVRTRRVWDIPRRQRLGIQVCTCPGAHEHLEESSVV